MTPTSPPVDDADLTRLPGWESLPADVRKRFGEARLPTVLLPIGSTATFVVDGEVAEIDHEPFGRFVRFGGKVGGTPTAFCLDPTSGEIVVVIPRIPPIFVNSGFDQFARTVRILGGFEDAITTGDADECAAAADEIQAAIKRFDTPAAYGSNYWGELLADVRAGNYSDNPDF